MESKVAMWKSRPSEPSGRPSDGLRASGRAARVLVAAVLGIASPARYSLPKHRGKRKGRSVVPRPSPAITLVLAQPQRTQLQAVLLAVRYV
jgi:hypothetical protein